MISTWYHPGFAADIGQHIMPMRKFSLVAEKLAQQPGIHFREPTPLTREELLLVHEATYIDAIRFGEPRSLAESQKFPWSPQLWPSVLLTNSGVLAAARCALESGISAVLASGFHHAHHKRGEGFCTFNGLVLAGELLRSEKRLKRVAVLDMDLHYGNGTASLATTRPWLRQLSIYGNDYWDNVSYRDVSILRHQDRENHRSVALPAGTDWSHLEKVILKHVPWLLEEARPDLLLYQAGADYLRDDPYSPLDLDHEALLARDRLVFRLAKEHGIPLAWTLAGGYSQDIEKIVQVHTNTFLAAREIYD